MISKGSGASKMKSVGWRVVTAGIGMLEPGFIYSDKLHTFLYHIIGLGLTD